MTGAPRGQDHEADRRRREAPRRGARRRRARARGRAQRAGCRERRAGPPAAPRRARASASSSEARCRALEHARAGGGRSRARREAIVYDLARPAEPAEHDPGELADAARSLRPDAPGRRQVDTIVRAADGISQLAQERPVGRAERSSGVGCGSSAARRRWSRSSTWRSTP